MKSVLEGAREAAHDVVIGVFVLILCGATACGRAEQLSPQEIVSSAKVAITPSTSDGSMLHNPAPASKLDVIGSASHEFSVKAEVVDAQWYNATTREPYAQALPSSFHTQSNGSTTVVSAFASSPLVYTVQFTPVYFSDGVQYEGQPIRQSYCLGD